MVHSYDETIQLVVRFQSKWTHESNPEPLSGLCKLKPVGDHLTRGLV